MAGGLGNTNENLNLFNEQVDRSVISVDRLGSALKQLSNVLPIQDIMKLQDSFANLNRTLALNYTEINRLNKVIDTLATQTKQYAKVELAGMISVIAKSNSAISANIANVEKLTRTFSNAYKQGAPQFLQLYVKMNEALPQLSARTEALSESVTTLNEVFKTGGKEGLSAYLTSIGKVSDETLKVEDTLSSSFKRLEKTFTDFKTKVGENTSGALKSVVDFAGGSELGMLATAGLGTLLAKTATGRVLGGLKNSLGLGGGSGGSKGGSGGMPLNMGGYQRSQFGVGWGFGPPSIGPANLPPLPTSAGIGSKLKNGFVNNAGIIGTGGLALGQALGTDTIAGGAATIAGGAATGFSFGGPWGALAGGTAGIGAVMMGSRERAQEKRASEIFGIRDAWSDMKEGKLRNQVAALSGSTAKEGSSNWYSDEASRNLVIANQQKARGGPEGLANYTSLVMKARDLSSKGYQIAGAQYGGALSEYQTALGFDPFSSSAQAGKALTSREGSIRNRISTLTDGGSADELAQVAQLKAELASIRKERYDLESSGAQRRSDFFGSAAGIAGSQAQGSLMTGAGLKDFTMYTELQKKSIDDQIKELEVVKQIAEKRGNTEGTLRAQAQLQTLINQKTQIQLEQSAKTVQLQLNAFNVKQKTVQLGTLKGAGTTLESLRAENAFINDQFAQADAGQITLSYDQRLAYSQRKKEMLVDANYQANVAQPLETRQTQTQAYETVQGSIGAMGTQEQLEIAKQRLEYLREEIALQEKNGQAISKNARTMNEANQKALEIQIEKINNFGKEKETLNFERDMNEKKLRIANLTKNPFLASKLYREQIEVSKNELMVLNKELELARSQGKGEDSEAVRNIKRQIGDKQVNIAQQLDFQRRSFAEQFTEQTLNMPNGSFLFPTMTSGAQNLGNAYYEGISQNGPRMNNRTYQSQVAGIFGEGASERSSFEELAGSLIDGLTSNDTVLNVRLVNDEGVNAKHSGSMP